MSKVKIEIATTSLVGQIRLALRQPRSGGDSDGLDRHSGIKTPHAGAKFLAVIWLSTWMLGCSQPASSAVMQPATFQLQVLNNCQLVSQRAMTAEEIQLHQQLNGLQQQMTALEAPLELMQHHLEQQHTQMETLAAQIEQQAGQGMPDSVLLEQQAELGQDMAAIVDSYQPQIDAVSSQGEQIGQLADQFTTLLKKDLQGVTYNQLRVLDNKQPPPKDCQTGLFFQHKN